MNSLTRFIFVTGGVVSSLGKGIASSSIAVLLQARGYNIKIRKLDPYLNIDPGTMSPYQHGEVFVTDDGTECDMDLGHYERFTGINATCEDNITTGQIYSKLLQRERSGFYLGGTVQVIPHVTNLIKEFILNDVESLDFLICEIGGTVGDIEGLPYFEAIRQLGYELGKNRVIYIHLTLVPYISSAKEIKTKPTQHSVKEMRSIGIQPDIILCRSNMRIPTEERKKIGLFCNVKEECVITALDQDNIYTIPLSYYEEGLDLQLLKLFNLKPNRSNIPLSKLAAYGKEDLNAQNENVLNIHEDLSAKLTKPVVSESKNRSDEPDLSKWELIRDKAKNISTEVSILIVGKYIKLADAYKSLIEAFFHAGIHNEVKVNLKWVDSEDVIDDTYLDNIEMHGIMVPGGFGDRGIEGKIQAIKYAREKMIPFFGICLGMQLSVIEFARNVLKIHNANSLEFDHHCEPVITLASEWHDGSSLQIRTESSNLGGTMRLGSYDCSLVENTLVRNIYTENMIKERHRHRFEFNNKYREVFSKAGMSLSGLSTDNRFVEIIELSYHPWFIGVQFHPELKSKPFQPHPLFTSFIANAKLND